MVVCFELGKTNEIKYVIASLREAISYFATRLPRASLALHQTQRGASVGARNDSRLNFNSFQESRCIQFAFEQIGEIALHQSLCFFLDLEARTRP